MNPHGKKYLVYTPEYGTVIPILDDGSGPMEYGADVMLVRAQNARRAKVLAVRAWRRKPWKQARWLHDCLSDGRSPFVGLKAERAEYPWLRGEAKEYVDG